MSGLRASARLEPETGPVEQRHGELLGDAAVLAIGGLDNAGLAELEEISGETIAVPLEIEGAEANNIIEIAAMFKAGGVNATWDTFKLVARPEILPQLSLGRDLRVVEQVYMHVLGRELHLGEREITLDRFEIAKTEPVGEGADGDLHVTCVPVPGDDRQIFMRLQPAVQPGGGRGL